jgi:hypothetical protein
LWTPRNEGTDFTAKEIHCNFALDFFSFLKYCCRKENCVRKVTATKDIPEFKHQATMAYVGKGKGKVKAILLQSFRGPEGSRRLRLPYFKTVDK